jgi:hypothetical protein
MIRAGIATALTTTAALTATAWMVGHALPSTLLTFLYSFCSSVGWSSQTSITPKFRGQFITEMGEKVTDSANM